jgi:hypothetical protein
VPSYFHHSIPYIGTLALQEGLNAIKIVPLFSDFLPLVVTTPFPVVPTTGFIAHSTQMDFFSSRLAETLKVYWLVESWTRIPCPEFPNYPNYIFFCHTKH